MHTTHGTAPPGPIRPYFRSLSDLRSVRLGMIEATLILLVLVLVAACVVVVLQVLLLRRLHASRAPDPAEEAAAVENLARRTGDVLEPRFDRSTQVITTALREPLTALRRESADAARTLREELTGLAAQARTESATRSTAQRKELAESLERLATALDARFESIRTLTQQKLDELRTANQAKLDEMRGVVEEKLQKTLEERVGAAFRSVGERLEQVHRGLGEMRGLVSDVGDLKRVLTNVKSRGTWGEVQLGAILEDFLSCDQYEVNSVVRPGSGEHVEFAIRIPAPEDGEPVLVPLDSKFPREDYERLVDARRLADAEAELAHGLALERRTRQFARTVREKYVHPPRTTPFAIMFVPTEGLYAELSQRPGLVDDLQREHQVMLAGPSTIAAFLHSLRLGFRALAIQKRSDEVWKVLGAAKSEFAKFGEVIDAVQKHLERAQNQLSKTGARTRQIGRALRSVEAMPDEEARSLLPADPAEDRAEAADDDDPGLAPPPRGEATPGNV